MVAEHGEAGVEGGELLPRGRASVGAAAGDELGQAPLAHGH